MKVHSNAFDAGSLGSLLAEMIGDRHLYRASDQPIWRIEQRGFHGRGYWNRKEKFLSLLLVEYHPCFIVHPDEPELDDDSGEWKLVAPQTWLLPGVFDTSSFWSWLSVGNWLIYAAAKPFVSTTHRDLTKFDVFSALLEEAQMRIAVFSYADDDPWFIGVPSKPHDAQAVGQ